MKPEHGFKHYPNYRDIFPKNPVEWANGRAKEDNHGDLWRVHDKLYNLSSFIDHHPGGRTWLENTRGTDITEVFESSHLNPRVNRILEKYYHSPALEPRNAPYTFQQNGFYLTLKRRVFQHLTFKVTREEKQARSTRTIAVHNSLISLFIFSLIAIGWSESYVFAVFSGLSLGLLFNCSHNFNHLRDNWRTFCIDLTIITSSDYRFVHCLQHHPFPNTLMDPELALYEPFMDLRVVEKSFLKRYSALPILFLTPQFYFFADCLRRLVSLIKGELKMKPVNFIVFSEILVLLTFGASLMSAFTLWITLQASCSYFVFFSGLISVHHHPSLYHAYDNYRFGFDWGLAQLDSVADRNDVDGCLFAELTLFGNHALHHLFPTLDHGLLDLIRPVFEETCCEFQVPTSLYKKTSYYKQRDLFSGLLQQAARVRPRRLTVGVKIQRRYA